MKEKLLKLKEQVMQNKKKAAGIGIAVLLLIGACGYGIAAMNMNNETAKTVQTEKKSVDQKSVKKETDKTSKKVDADENSDTKDKKTDEKKSADDKKEIKKTENEKKSTAKDSSTKSSDAGSTNSSQPAGNTNTQPSVPEYTPEPAPQPEPDPAPPVHTHDYSNPIYEEQSVWIDTSGYVSKEILRCGICDEEVTGFEGKHLEDHALAGEGVGNTYSDWKEVWEESGYWGTESVITGYKCSCGAVQ